MTLGFGKGLTVQMLVPLIVESILRHYLIDLQNKIASVHGRNYPEQSHIQIQSYFVLDHLLLLVIGIQALQQSTDYIRSVLAIYWNERRQIHFVALSSSRCLFKRNKKYKSIRICKKIGGGGGGGGIIIK